jgi:hypothetical protein
VTAGEGEDGLRLGHALLLAAAHAVGKGGARLLPEVAAIADAASSAISHSGVLPTRLRQPAQEGASERSPPTTKSHHGSSADGSGASFTLLEDLDRRTTAREAAQTDTTQTLRWVVAKLGTTVDALPRAIAELFEASEKRILAAIAQR